MKTNNIQVTVPSGQELKSIMQSNRLRIAFLCGAGIVTLAALILFPPLGVAMAGAFSIPAGGVAAIAIKLVSIIGIMYFGKRFLENAALSLGLSSSQAPEVIGLDPTEKTRINEYNNNNRKNTSHSNSGRENTDDLRHEGHANNDDTNGHRRSNQFLDTINSNPEDHLYGGRQRHV